MNYEPTGGEHLSETINRIIALAVESDEVVTATFNDIELKATATDSAEGIEAVFRAESKRRRAEYLASPEYKQRQAESEAKQNRKEIEFAAAMLSAPKRLTLTDEAAWKSWEDANTDPYGARCVSYANDWARLMEWKMSQGYELESYADLMSHLADTDGITGLMYRCAVAMLAKAWVHGERLRIWHNKKTQIGTEGDRANETGGVLNPALLNIG